MNTNEIAKINKTAYFIEYICSDLNSTYYQLVRTEDQAILCAFTEIEYVFSYCFQHAINRNGVSIW